MDDDIRLHETQSTQQENDGSVTVTIPASAVEESGIEPGESVYVGAKPGEMAVVLPWSEDDVREMLE